MRTASSGKATENSPHVFIFFSFKTCAFREKKMFSTEIIIGVKDKDGGHNKLVVKQCEWKKG